jgi:deoxyribodipyrimidine photo-lyase
MSKLNPITIFWFRRDLRLSDNAGLFNALKGSASVLPLFIFDDEILINLDNKSDPRVTFIYKTVCDLKIQVQAMGSDLLVRKGQTLEVFKSLFENYKIEAVYTNNDYEPAAIRRDKLIANFVHSRGATFKSFKDQTLFEKDEILTGTNKAYSVYTPYKNKVLGKLDEFYLKSYPNDLYQSSLLKLTKKEKMLELSDLGFTESSLSFPAPELSSQMLKSYEKNRNFPYLNSATSHLGLHLRFGTLSIRELAREGKKYSDVWLSELIWRDFFMQILWHYPHVENQSFRPEYDKIAWRNSPEDFQRWKEGTTGYLLVDAGMRELNATGYMHNRVRMLVASFLCKHLLIHWHQGERYFAKKLLDYDLSANSGNWQWAAGSGCDAAPYFRIFNPMTQQEKFDPDLVYVKKWVPEYQSQRYPDPMVEHTFGRDRCLQAYGKILKKEAI